jgi:hypothetical protein
MKELEASVADHSHRQTNGGPAAKDLANLGVYL